MHQHGKQSTEVLKAVHRKRNSVGRKEAGKEVPLGRSSGVRSVGNISLNPSSESFNNEGGGREEGETKPEKAKR